MARPEILANAYVSYHFQRQRVAELRLRRQNAVRASATLGSFLGNVSAFNGALRRKPGLILSVVIVVYVVLGMLYDR